MKKIKLMLVAFMAIGCVALGSCGEKDNADDNATADTTEQGGGGSGSETSDTTGGEDMPTLDDFVLEDRGDEVYMSFSSTIDNIEVTMEATFNFDHDTCTGGSAVVTFPTAEAASAAYAEMLRKAEEDGDADDIADMANCRLDGNKIYYNIANLIGQDKANVMVFLNLIKENGFNIFDFGDDDDDWTGGDDDGLLPNGIAAYVYEDATTTRRTATLTLAGSPSTGLYSFDFELMELNEENVERIDDEITGTVTFDAEGNGTVSIIEKEGRAETGNYDFQIKIMEASTVRVVYAYEGNEDGEVIFLTKISIED